MSQELALPGIREGRQRGPVPTPESLSKLQALDPGRQPRSVPSPRPSHPPPGDHCLPTLGPLDLVPDRLPEGPQCLGVSGLSLRCWELGMELPKRAAQAAVVLLPPCRRRDGVPWRFPAPRHKPATWQSATWLRRPGDASGAKGALCVGSRSHHGRAVMAFAACCSA